MRKSHIELGRIGEEEAAVFLKKRGFKIICLNYRNRLGQIDIIAKQRRTICFLEVKTRQSDRFGQPKEAINSLKQRKISQAALMFLKQEKLLDSPTRFDVVSISYPDAQPKIELIKNAFELNKNYLY